MKRVFVIALMLGLASGGMGVAAEEGSHMHEMMMEGGEGAKNDSRTELKLPAMMKTMQKRMMREHLNTVSEITAMLASNDLKKAAEAASVKLGWNEDEEARCEKVSEVTGERDFVALGKAMHTKADELSDAAKAGKRDEALVRLSELIKNCNACHDRFRH